MLKQVRTWVLACALVFGWATASALTAPAVAATTPPAFSGKLELVPLFKNCKASQPRGAGPKCPIIVNGHQYYAVRNPISLRTQAGDIVTVFAGQQTDLASIPKVIWPLMPPDGPWAMAAVIHDSCYRTHGQFVWYAHQGRSRAAPYVRAECDDILRQGMVALHVSAWERVTIWSAVRIGGGAGWGR